MRGKSRFLWTKVKGNAGNIFIGLLFIAFGIRTLFDPTLYDLVLKGSQVYIVAVVTILVGVYAIALTIFHMVKNSGSVDE
jgi:uncharacterized membrane protein